MLKFTSAVLSPALINKRFDNTRKIGQIRPPMLIGFNLEDRTVPWRMSQRLTNFAPASARSYLGPNGKKIKNAFPLLSSPLPAGGFVLGHVSILL